MAEVIQARRDVTVVTGASSGIGRELALLAARQGEVLLVARGEQGLRALATQIVAEGGRATWLTCDGEERDAAAQITRHLAANGMSCLQLVNNAGHGIVGLAHRSDCAAQIGSIDLNVRFLTDLALAVLPGMVERGKGGILNVASVASFLPGPGMAVYYAGKAYVQTLSESLWEEVRESGVRITSLCPGPVDTGFLGRATGGAKPRETSIFHVPASEVARTGWEAFQRGQRTIIPGFANKMAAILLPFLPRPILLKMVMRRQSGRQDGR